MLERIFWKGTSRGFTFDTFVSRLQGAYHDLAEYGDVRTDESKVDTLLTKVSGDSSLSSACTFIRNDADLSVGSLILSEQLARRWRTSLECATRTLNKTEQRALRDWTRVQGDRCFRPTQLQLRYPRINCVMYCDVKVWTLQVFGRKHVLGSVCD